MTVFIALGANLGHPLEQCLSALCLLDQIPHCAIMRTSNWFLTEPEGDPDQPWFVNGVAEVEWRGEVSGLLAVCRGVETKLGRPHPHPPGPRSLDLDILLVDQKRFSMPGLVIPHPRLHRRRFVLLPLCDLVPEMLHPVLGQSMKELLDSCQDSLRIRQIGRMGGEDGD